MTAPKIFTALIFVSLASANLAHASDVDWSPGKNNIQTCFGLQKNISFMFKARANGATETFAEMKADVKKFLSGKGEAETKLLAIYENILPRIEAGEFSPPKFEHAAGQVEAKQTAGKQCLQAFPN
ncbi:MAG: hypothetical protein WCC58_11145 [Burkholderiales bacterium]